MKFALNTVKVNIAIFNLKMSIVETGLLAIKMFLAPINGQLGQCSLGTLDLDKLCLYRTFPLYNYRPFIHVKKITFTWSENEFLLLQKSTSCEHFPKFSKRTIRLIEVFVHYPAVFLHS